MIHHIIQIDVREERGTLSFASLKDHSFFVWRELQVFFVTCKSNVKFVNVIDVSD